MIYADLESTLPVDDENATYRRLWAAVLIQAIRDYNVIDRVENKGIMDSNYEQFDVSGLKKWLAGDAMGPGTFAWICNLLELEVEETRQSIYANPSIFIGARKVV